MLLSLVLIFGLVGFAIAANVGKTKVQVFFLGIALTLGLMIVAAGVVFAGCALLMSNMGRI